MSLSRLRLSRCSVFTLVLSFFAWGVAPLEAFAYVGPGAGFAFVSSFFILFFAFFLALLTLLTWPIRWVFKALKRMRGARRGKARRVVIIGLDGMDPELTERYMAEGLLPNLQRLSEQGAYARLGTSLPAESPVAWSCFQTGCNPGKHRIYDFLVPNRKTLLPELSSAHVRVAPRALKLGKYCIPIGKPSIDLGRRSQPFWNILSRYGVFSSILRVPITFPPDKFSGVMLSAMCLPDLKGSQGTYFYYTSDQSETRSLTSGVQRSLRLENGAAYGEFPGPENTMVDKGGEMRLPFELRLNSKSECDAELIIGKQRYPLRVGQYTPYIRLVYKAGLGVKVHGICRFLLLESTPHVRLYQTPIQIDPEKPALPISHPYTYAVYLAKQQGEFSTPGVAEDTSALNEGVIDEDAFLEQCQSIHAEREAMFFDALEKTPRGAVVCVFDITDRLQHMFFRCLDETHPANRDRETERYKDHIKQLYIQMDELVGRAMAALEKDKRVAFMVLSDHGFKPFRREVNLNAWLKAHGFLAVKPGAEDADLLQAIDWSRTRAYAVGFGGVYLNLKDREAQGVVAPEEAEALKREIGDKLLQLHDEQEDARPIKQVYDRNRVYSGPYAQDAPDLIAGFQVGYRAAWRAVTGGVGDVIVSDNTRPWSGDHNMNPGDVPGVFFYNRPIVKEAPHITDIAPTVLDLFGVPAPKYMDGESLNPVDSER